MKRIPAALLLLVALPANAPVYPDTAAMTDPQLAAARGGFDLPNGLQIMLAVTTETRIDGQLSVRSSWQVANGAPVLTVQGRDPSTGQLVTLDPTVGGGVITADGVIRLQNGPDGARVLLNGTGIDVAHLAGRALGSVISNSANDRVVDVLTTVQIDIANASPELIGSALLRVDDIAANAGSLVRP
jgi:hypothetical protein